jgi:RNA polymerase sigma-70 factor (ECF subfamily)
VSSPLATRFPALLLSTKSAERKAPFADGSAGSEDATDETLIARLCSGDAEALAFLFQRHARLVRSVATRILRDGTEAEDLVQDLFLFIQRKSGIFESSKSSAR